MEIDLLWLLIIFGNGIIVGGWLVSEYCSRKLEKFMLDLLRIEKYGGNLVPPLQQIYEGLNKKYKA